MFRVSFTGYRPEKLPFFGEDDPLCAELKKRLFTRIEALVEDGAEEFCSGMARGVDTWAAEAVLELKRSRPEIRLTAVVPCPEQAEKWGREQSERYNAILAKCDKTITVSPSYTKSCMEKRNKALVDLCDLLIAVYDGKPGGTMQTVNYAKSKNRRVIIINPI